MSELVLENQLLPTNWIMTNIESICFDSQYGWTTSASNNGNVKFLRTTDITSGKINWETVPYCAKNPDKLDKYLLKNGDVVISRAGSIGFSHLIESPPKAVFASYLIRFNPLIFPKYFSYFLQSNQYWNEISERKIGIAVQNVNATKLKHIKFPLSPLNEQKRIVAKIEELFSILSFVRDIIQLTKSKIILYEKTAFKNAFNGKLTQPWRQKNKPRHSELLFDESISNQKKQNPKFQKFEIDKTPQTNLPNEWMWVCLGNYAVCSRGRFSIRPRNDPMYYNGNHPFIQIGDLPPKGGLINSHSQTLNDAGLKISKKFQKGTVAIAIVGATIGNTGILGYDMCFPDSLIGINCDYIISNRFIEYYLRSIKEKIRNISYSSGGQPNINSNTINYLPIPLPSIEEQSQIVNILDSNLTLLNSITDNLFKLEKKINLLSLLILKQAFEGKLVPQDPNDEPAEILLQKIKQERISNDNHSKTSRIKKNV